MPELQNRIEELWERRDLLTTSDADAFAVVRNAIDLLDRGEARVAEVDPATDDVIVHQWLKQAILLLFKLSAMETVESGPFEYHDKIPLKRDHAAAGVRAVPGSVVRWGAFLDRGVILMPSFVNIGARVGADTMVDTWATVGSCAQIGAGTHLSGGVGIGGVLEPPQAAPVMVGDRCLIGSRCMVVNGARVGDESVLGAGTILTGNLPVIDAETGEEVSRGIVPPRCVVVYATRPKKFGGGEFGLPCALIIRRLEPGERQHLNEILRESEVAVE